MRTTPRVLVGELMDDPGLAPSAHRRALRALARLNALSRADAPIWHAIRAHHARTTALALAPSPIRLLDVAAGSADVLVRVCRRAAREGIDVTPSACDISPEACAAAEARAAQAGVRLETHLLDALRDPLPTGFDVVCSTLFLHHLTERDATRVLASMREATNDGLVLVSDLARTRAGLALAAIASRLTTRSPIVHTDAVRSVRAAWTRDELSALFTNAAMPAPRVARVWPERWLATWDGRRDA